MILQITILAAVTQFTAAWPITPLDEYNRIDTQYLSMSCGNETEIKEGTFTNLNVTFIDAVDGNIEAGCTVKLRIAIQDLDVSKFGVQVTGTVSVSDDANGDDCSSSYLSVADEDDLDDELGSIERYCNNEVIDFKTTEDIIVIEFVVGNNGAAGTGFQLNISPHYLCGGSIDLEMAITSPDFPEPYPRDINCVWRVEAPAGHHIVLKCNDFDLKPKRANKCLDYFFIVGSGRYCGNELQNKEIISRSNVMVMDFRSNKVPNQYKGFNCRPKFISDNRDLLLAKFFK